MNDFPEKRRSKKLRVSSKENMENIVHREVEKQRRQEMASLYASLRSLLPLDFVQGKRSMSSDQVNGAVNYIEYLQRNIKDMSSKRDDLMLLSGRSFGSTKEQGWNEMSNHVVVRLCLVGVEIVLSVLQTPFSSVCKCFVNMVSVILAASPPV